MEKCPYCDGTSGYYEKSINRVEQYYEWDGTEADNFTYHIRGGKVKYCTDCGKTIKGGQS